MKKLISVLIALMMFCCALPAALAENADWDFGSFTLTLDSEIPMQTTSEIVENEAFCTIFPAFRDNDTATNMNIVWTKSYQDIASFSSSYISSYLNTVMESTKEQMAASGIQVNSIRMLENDVVDLDGKPALYYAMALNVDYSGMGSAYQGLVMDLISCQWLVGADESVGSFFFTLTAFNEESAAYWGDAILSTLRWK